MKQMVLKRGFTLVELMIVVSIIGLLAALAIPNFIRFQAKSKQAEAKTSLKAIFQGQKSYYGEYDRYSTLMGDIGFAPERGNRYAYDLGTTALTASTTGAFQCTAVQVRTAATVNVTAGTQAECGVDLDIFRYGSAMVPTNFAGRSSAAWQASVVGNPAMPTDGIGVNVPSCPGCDFAARAFGQLDNDSGADEMFVGSQFATVAPTLCAEVDKGTQPGAPVEVRNDVSCE